jgi:Fic family protein
MSAHRLGRLLGSLLLIAALVALPALTIDNDLHMFDYNWQMPAVQSLVP